MVELWDDVGNSCRKIRLSKILQNLTLVKYLPVTNICNREKLCISAGNLKVKVKAEAKLINY